jgi:hypothetical protein
MYHVERISFLGPLHPVTGSGLAQAQVVEAREEHAKNMMRGEGERRTHRWGEEGRMLKQWFEFEHDYIHRKRNSKSAC